MSNDARMLSEIQAVILDGDGVLWRGNEPLPGLQALFGFFKSNGIPYILATNNSTSTVQDYVRKLVGYGIEAGPQNVVTSGIATADYLRATYGEALRVHVVGEPGLHEVMWDAGYPSVMVGAEVVVVGLDRDVTYEKLRRATVFIRGWARFIGTNGDPTFPAPGGLVPGAGSILAALEAATGQKPFVVGKPEPTMFAMAMRRLGSEPTRTLMVGDRLETDILGAQRAGLVSALVMSGVTSAAQLEAGDIKPEMIFDDIGALQEAWQGAFSMSREGR
jgi:4-nitrophenyl phosphatase